MRTKRESRQLPGGLEKVASLARVSAADVPLHMVITSFAGLRATEKNEDFVLGEAKDAEGFFNAAGIESPGLSSAPAIGEYLAQMTAEYLHAKRRTILSAQGRIFPTWRRPPRRKWQS